MALRSCNQYLALMAEGEPSKIPAANGDEFAEDIPKEFELINPAKKTKPIIRNFIFLFMAESYREFFQEDKFRTPLFNDQPHDLGPVLFWHFNP